MIDLSSANPQIHFVTNFHDLVSAPLYAETNAILFANRDRLVGSTLYVYPLSPCVRCATNIIQSGIKRVVAPSVKKDSSKDA